MAPRTGGGPSPLIVASTLVLSIAGFVLGMICLFAGSKPGQLEEFHVISINMSSFGKNLIPTPTSGGSQPTSTNGGLGGLFSSVVATIESSIGNELNGIANDVADKLSQKLGISQWYSLHIMNSCEGDFAPNATTPGAWYNTTNCTAQQAGYQFNLSQILDHEIGVGPIGLNPANLRLPDEIQNAVRYLNGFLLAVFVFYVLGSGFSGLSFLFCIVMLSMRSLARAMPLVNAINAGLAAFTLGIASAITTAIAKKGEQEINNRGRDVGISATAGGKFMIITWVAFAVMFVALILMVMACCVGRRSRKRGAYGEKTTAGRANYEANGTGYKARRSRWPRFGRRV